MITAINETCIGEGGFFGVGNGYFLVLDEILCQSIGFPPNGWFGEKGREVHIW